MKRISVCMLALIMIVTLTCSAGAVEIQPFANEYYASASVAFNDEGETVFSALTTFQFNTLSVTSCVLQIKNGSSWSTSVVLTPPAHIARNRYSYLAQVNYADSCEPGNIYRIKAVFDADGHTITKYSIGVDF